MLCTVMMQSCPIDAVYEEHPLAGTRILAYLFTDSTLRNLMNYEPRWKQADGPWYGLHVDTDSRDNGITPWMVT